MNKEIARSSLRTYLKIEKILIRRLFDALQNEDVVTIINLFNNKIIKLFVNAFLRQKNSKFILLSLDLYIDDVHKKNNEDD